MEGDFGDGGGLVEEGDVDGEIRGVVVKRRCGGYGGGVGGVYFSGGGGI